MITTSITNSRKKNNISGLRLVHLQIWLKSEDVPLLVQDGDVVAPVVLDCDDCGPAQRKPWILKGLTLVALQKTKMMRNRR